MINVTKTFLPSFDEYSSVLKRAWDKAWITNNGELVQELEHNLKEYLGVKHLFFCTNGTIVLQMALKALDITKEVITTPFSYVATVNAILWENCTPVFVDIEKENFCIDPEKIEAKINENTQAIVATHVFGYNCDIEKIESIAQKHGIKVIYDGAHAFGSQFKGKSLLSYGDLITCSFHATKLFHTVEGGCIITSNDELARKLFLFRQFGHDYDDYLSVGINAKNSEFHAAMGLCVLPRISDLIQRREELSHYYDSILNEKIIHASTSSDLKYNFSYYPILFKDESTLIRVFERLKSQNILARRYFYPSLNKLPFVNYEFCPNSEDISKRILCLPLFFELEKQSMDTIGDIINRTINE